MSAQASSGSCVARMERSEMRVAWSRISLRPSGLRSMSFDVLLDLRACDRPVIVEVCDDFFHEAFRQGYRAVLVAEVIVENCKRELLRALALVGPLEAAFCETLDLVVLR